MNSRDALEAPLFLLSDEDRLMAETVKRWQDAMLRTRPMQPEPPQNAKNGHSSLPDSVPPLSDRQAAVFAVLRDGAWHSTEEFLGPNVGGSEGLRRLRELRAKGFQIERKKIAGRSSWMYRLKKGEI